MIRGRRGPTAPHLRVRGYLPAVRRSGSSYRGSEPLDLNPGRPEGAACLASAGEGVLATKKQFVYKLSSCPPEPLPETGPAETWPPISVRLA